jgi:hypothetical protein
MTMRNLMWAVLAAACLLAGSGVSMAQDTVRLGGPSVQADMQGGTDLVRGWHGYRGYYGGYRGYYGGYYGGYRGYYGGYYGFYRPYYPRYYASYYYPPVVYQPSCYTPYYSNSYYYPIAGQPAPTVTMQASYYAPAPASSQPTPGQRFSEPIPAPGGNGTFPYDGGPRSPIPMPAPGADINPATDRGIIPLDGKLVSIPNETSGGFSPVGLPAVQPRTTPTTTTPATKTPTPAPRVIYPAYGDR